MMVPIGPDDFWRLHLSRFSVPLILTTEFSQGVFTVTWVGEALGRLVAKHENSYSKDYKNVG
jgi:hypothetical protein